LIGKSRWQKSNSKDYQIKILSVKQDNTGRLKDQADIEELQKINVDKK